MTELARKIGLSEELICEAEKLYFNKMSELQKAVCKCESGSFGCLRRKTPLFRLVVILLLAVKVKESYDRSGISEEIYYDTMGDIKIWCDKCNGKGLKNFGWLKNHVSFELFRLGRLQFQLYECKNKTLNYKKLPFAYGERLIYVHIPEGEPLDREKCILSLRLANEFFGNSFPDYSYSFYFCESWLLFEGNREFMSQESNIVRFMSLFDVCYSLKIDEQAVERVFGKRKLFVKAYPANTDLQRRLKKYMAEGKRAGIGVGVIKKEEFSNEQMSALR